MFICNQFTKSIPCKRLNLTLFMICTVFLIIEIPINLHIQQPTQDNFPYNEIEGLKRTLAEHPDSDSYSFELDNCHCKRTLSYKNTKVMFDKVSYWTDWTAIGLMPPFNGSEQHDGVYFNDTTCSPSAFKRGPGQKIVAFSIYGNLSSDESRERGYFEGIRDNLRLMPYYYPGWIMRLYHDLSNDEPSMKALCQLACENTILDLCNVDKLPGTPTIDASKIFPRIWRFFPSMDPQVDVIASRDLDSRINQREATAVKEWQERSKLPIHVMRDHPQHTIGMLAGTWSADLRRKNSRKYFKDTWKRILQDPLTYSSRKLREVDQEILGRYVWRRFARRLSIAHDSYLCESNPRTIGWPTQRKIEVNNFVGAVFRLNITLDKKCPLKCRRNRDWEYC